MHSVPSLIVSCFRGIPLLVLILGAWILPALGGTTGKMSGKVADAAHREPLVGVNVTLEGTKMGAATDVDGEFIIINIPPGTYTVNASLLGYHPARLTKVQVSVDLTTQVALSMTESSVDLKEEVVVIAERPMVQKDITSTSTHVNSDQIKAYPVEDVAGLVNLQAGVVEGHFRGGRAGEVLYLIDGIPVTDAYSGGSGINAETHSIQELEIISGTFNAEYGQAMSGVVNQITKDGGEKYSGEVSFYCGDYVSRHKDLFMHIDKVRPTDIRNIEGSIGGPVPGISGTSFFLSGRSYYNDGYLYGKRIFLPTDSSNFASDTLSRWYIGATGDGAYVPMNYDRRGTLQGKLSLSLFGTDKLRLSFMMQNSDYKNYDQRYKYNPDGTYSNFARSKLGTVSYSSVFSPSTYLDVHAAWYSNREESYVYEDPSDPRFPSYQRKLQTSGAAFLTGGAEDLHLHRESRYLTGKIDLVSQIDRENQVKAGGEFKQHRIWIHNFGIANDQSTGFVPRPVEFGRSEFANTTLLPVQFAAYIQDKIELEDLIVNVGVRYDYFNPRANILVEALHLGFSPQLQRAQSEMQISPRIGLAYPITDRGVLHLSYGHFFQVPQFDLMFLNPAYNINNTEAFQVGNPGLKSQRTVGYELGLQQQLSDDIKADVTGYYKDSRNLIGTEIFDIGNGNKYSQYVNRDYGNTRGFTLSLEKRHTHGFSATIDYTFQIAQGNASDPNAVFLDNQTSPPRQSQKQLAPLDWDRRHSLNVTATIGTLEDFTVTLIGRLGSGLPYTPAFQSQRTGLLNSETRPTVVTADLYATKFFTVSTYAMNIFVKVYNLFDTKNELDVFSDTGRAGYSLEANYAGQPRGINTIQEYFTRPDFYSAPRQVIVGVGFSF